LDRINKLRDLIDEIDLKIADLVEERVKLAKKIGILKTEKGMPILQPEREAEIIHNMKKTISTLSTESTGAIWKEIIKACRMVEENQLRKKIPIESSSDGTIIESLDILIESDLMIYGEEVIFDQIDTKESFTRYLILSNQAHDPTDHDKTSIIFVTLDQPGQLSNVIQLFAEMNINLTKIESRPRKRDNDTWEYVFFLEFEGNANDSKIATILGSIESVVKWIKVLGSYPKAEVHYGR
jgi:prephenate dehydratase